MRVVLILSDFCRVMSYTVLQPYLHEISYDMIILTDQTCDASTLALRAIGTGCGHSPTSHIALPHPPLPCPPPAYPRIQACTMQNPLVTFTCHLCGTVDEGRRAKAKEAGDGAAEDGVSPALLARLARDGHFSLQSYLVSLAMRNRIYLNDRGMYFDMRLSIRVLVGFDGQTLTSPSVSCHDYLETPLNIPRGEIGPLCAPCKYSLNTVGGTRLFSSAGKLRSLVLHYAEGLLIPDRIVIAIPFANLDVISCRPSYATLSRWLRRRWRRDWPGLASTGRSFRYSLS